MTVPPAWSTQQLAEFLAAISVAPDRHAAGRIAVERAAEALEAEVGALVFGAEVEASVGFPAGVDPVAQLMAVASGERDRIELSRAGGCRAVAVPLDGSGHLVIGRLGDEVFSRDELVLARSMARVLTLSRRALSVLENERALREESERQGAENARLFESLARRQQLLERLSEVQRAIVRRAGREHVLQMIVSDVAELTNEDLAFLRLIDPSDPSNLMIVAHEGLERELVERIRNSAIGTGASGTAVAEDRVVVMNDYMTNADHNPVSAKSGVRATIAAPVHQQGAVVGALVVGSYQPGREYGLEEREVLEAFAENASIALTDASMVDAAFDQAYRDSLTGLPNRAAILERLEPAQAGGDRRDGAAGVLFLDIDRFKTVNDSLGHAAGDELLIAVADRLRACVRSGDTPARLGGDEFAILLEAPLGPGEAERIAGRVLAGLRAPLTIQGRQIPVTASVGIATGSGGTDDLLRDADLAMYRAKAGGRDRFETFEDGMRAELVERLGLEADLRLAVEEEQFVLHYQPIVDLATGAIVGLEALVRWEHPERGLIGPGEFIPLAEETRAIVGIGRAVLREACRRGAAWCGRHGGLMMTVNLSAAQLEDADLVEDLADALRESGLEPGRLVLEITETVLMSDSAHAVGRLGELKALGVRIAVDDFGTGYSSLQYLRELPLDVLKVAKTFVDGLAGGLEGGAFARAIIDLGESCGLTVVGEGIELDEQRAGLLELGCPLGQGFLFAKPLPAGSIDALLGERRSWDLPEMAFDILARGGSCAVDD